MNWFLRGFLILLFLALAALAVHFSMNDDKTGTAISVVGSVASIYAIIEALVKVKTLSKHTKEIEIAVKSKERESNKKETAEHKKQQVEVINRVQQYIDVNNAEAAILKMEEVKAFLFSIKNNPTTPSKYQKSIPLILNTLNSDILSLRNRESNEAFPSNIDRRQLNKNFSEIQNILSDMSQQIHFDDDKQ